MGMNVIRNYQCIIIKMHMEDVSRDHLSFTHIIHVAIHGTDRTMPIFCLLTLMMVNNGSFTMVERHHFEEKIPGAQSVVFELPLHQTLQRPMHLPKDTNDFYKVCCKGANTGLLPTCPCDTRDSISTSRQEAPAKV